MERAHKRYWRAGFTLLELLIVIVILGLIMAIATPQLMKVLGGAKQDAARLQMRALEQTLDLYRLDVGKYPTSEQGLDALLKSPAPVAGWSGPYVRSSEQLTDPWGARYIYKSPDGALPFSLTSFGEDAAPSGEGEAADIQIPSGPAT